MDSVIDEIRKKGKESVQKEFEALCEMQYDFNRASFHGLNLSGSVLNCPDFRNCKLLNSNLSRSQLNWPVLMHADLTNCNLLQAKLGECVSVFCHKNPVLSVAVRKDGKFAAIAERNDINLVELKSGRKSILKAHDSGVYYLAFSDCSELLASGSYDYVINIWKLYPTEILYTFSEFIGAPVFSPKGNLLAVSDLDKTINLFDIHTGKNNKIIEREARTVSFICFSESSSLIAVAHKTKQVKVWLLPQKRMFLCTRNVSFEIKSLAFSNCESFLVIGGMSQKILVWNLKKNLLHYEFEGHESNVTSVKIYKDRYVVSSSLDCSIKIWDLSNASLVHTILGHSEKVTFMCTSDQYIVSASADKSVKVWELPLPFTQTKLFGHRLGVTSMALDGKYMVSGGLDNSIILWDTESYRILYKVSSQINYLNAVAIAGEGKWIAGGGSREITSGVTRRNVAVGSRPILLVEEMNKVHKLLGHRDIVNTLSFCLEKNVLVSGSCDRSVIIWSLASKEPVISCSHHTGGISKVSIYENFIVSGSYDKTVKVLSFEYLECVLTIDAHSNPVYCLAVRKGLVASGSKDSAIKVWIVKTGQLKYEFGASDKKFNSLEFSESGKFLLSSSNDHILRLWNVKKGVVLQSILGHSSRICSALFDNDDRYIISGSLDSNIRVWKKWSDHYSSYNCYLLANYYIE